MKYIITLLIFALWGCSTNKKQQAPTKETGNIPVINLSESVSEVASFLLSEVASKVEIVPLEITDESLIGDVYKLKVTDSDIWIKQYSDEHLFRFSHSGKYLNKVGIIGQGPQEYIRMSEFFIDNNQKEVYIVTTTCGVKVYDFEGKFKRIATKLLSHEIFAAPYIQYILFNNNFFISQNIGVEYAQIPKDSLWSFALVDSSYQKKKIFKNPAHVGKEEQIVKNRIRHDKFVNYWLEAMTNIDTYGNELTLKYPDTDTIYQYDEIKEELHPLYSIFTNEEKGDYEYTHLWFKERKAFDYFSIKAYFPCKDFIYLTGTKGDKIYTYCYNKQDGSVRMQEQQGEITEQKVPWFTEPFRRMEHSFILNNDLCGGNFRISHRSSGNYWINLLIPDSKELIERIEQVKTAVVKDNLKKQDFIKILENLSEETNPILVIATLK